MVHKYLLLLQSGRETNLQSRSQVRPAKVIVVVKGMSLDDSQGIPRGLVSWFMLSKLYRKPSHVRKLDLSQLCFSLNFF